MIKSLCGSFCIACLHPWHFRFALGLVIKSLCGSFCIACLHPLTRRYVS
nr:DUF3265 domain-containing protein [Vibrio vulnificus]